MSFALTGSESILIYGAGEQGKELVSLFRENGFPVKAVLDKRAEKLKQITVGETEICVIDPEQYVVDSGDEIVVISLWNAMQHEKIAVVLQRCGFKKIIYLPMSTTGNYRLMSEMRKVFNELLVGNLYLQNIPEYLDIIENSDSYRHEDVLYLPIELLFAQENFETKLDELNEIEYLKRQNVLKYSGENLMNVNAYYQMYRYLDRAEGDCADYLNTQIDATAADLEAERKKVLKDRYELFQVYEKAFELDREFFIDSAPRAIWNQKGYFNIHDGHHRVSYLYYKGIRDIPVRVDEEGRERLKMFDDISGAFLCESPALVNTENSLFWRKQNEIICRSLLKKDVLGKQIYVNINDAGYISRYCCRVGCEHCMDLETGEKAEFARQMCEIFQYQNHIMIREDLKELVDADIAVMDEKCLADRVNVRAKEYIIILERQGNLHDVMAQKDIRYEQLGAAFNGEKDYLIIRIGGEDICFL